MKFAQVNRQLFDVLDKLIKQDLPFKASYRIKRIAEKLQKEAQLFESGRLELLKKFAKKDESGELVVDEEGNAQFEEGRFKEYQVKYAEMALTDVEIGFDPIPADLLDKAICSGTDIAILGDLLAE